MARLLITMIMILFGSPMAAGAGVVLELGDILVMDPAGIIWVVDPSTGAKTVVAQGGLLSSAYKTVGVAFAPDGDLIVVRRDIGLIRVNPVTESQSILSQGGSFKDPWAIAIDNVTGYIYVADSGFDLELLGPRVNEAGKIIRVHPVSGAQEVIAAGTPCTFFPERAACQNTTSAGSYLAHPYGIAIDDSTVPATLIVADMSSFNGKGAIIRIQAVPDGAQTLVWGPATASPRPQVAQSSPLGCPMGVAVEPNGNILTTTFTYLDSGGPPPTPTVPPPANTVFGCAAPGIFRLDLTSNVQAVVNTNAPRWQPGHAYSVGDVIFEEVTCPAPDLCPHVHRVVTAGISQSFPVPPPSWNANPAGITPDGSVVWENIGLGANWSVPFGLAVEPALTPSNPSRYNIVVPDEGYGMVFRLDADGRVLAAPLAEGFPGTPSVHVITITPPDAPPARFNGQPAGVLPAGTTQATLGLTTNEAATCRYSTQPGVAYASMTNTFTTTGATTHSTGLSGLANSQSYSFYVRCADAAGNANTNDFVIAFSVASSSATITFVGTESVLSENGRWDSPGAWADLHKNNGAYASGLNAQARLVTPAVAADQYAEITYDQDPGPNGSWVGVATRIQGATNGSGYLAIVYAGQVRLYRTDDSGGLIFTLLESASPATGTTTGTAPRKLRLESEGNIHRVFFNDVLRITHNATAPIYERGQPGMAASVFGGPQVKILSFEGGNLGASPIDTTPPETSITSHPAAVTSATSATFTFISNEAGSSFQCRLDAAAFAACTSPWPLSGLAAGPHTFEVRATDIADNTDPSPASFSWVIDVVPPVRSNGFPAGTFPTATPPTTLGLTTDEPATCRYSTQSGVAYGAMTGMFTTTGATTHSAALSGLANNEGHWFYVRCTDTAGNANTNDFVITFAVGSAATSIFVGTESPLNEGGRWDSPGHWEDLHKSDGAYASGLNAQARLVTPVVAADQYAEITYDQDPGSSSWVGVATRTQGPGNGSGYLAIVYAGEVRLYRTVDSTNLNFTLLVSASAALGSEPRRLRLESQGNIHRVYFNGELMISHSPPSGPTYATGQPGIAASVFGGPQVKILSFDGGTLGASPVDTIPPDTTIGSTPPSFANSGSATFTFSSTETGATFQCSLDGATPTNCTSPRTLSGLAAGSHTFEVRAIDSSGNIDPSPASFTWLIDLTAPETTILTGPPSPTNSTSATFTFSSEVGSTFECQLDNAVFAACSTPISYSGLASGSHTFRVRAKDAAGNVDGSPAVYTWIIDTTAPNTTITASPATASSSTSATFTFTATMASTFQCRLDGASPSSCTSPVTYSSLAQGGHTFEVRATDLAGNPDPTPASFSWTVDSVVPDTTIVSTPPSLSNSGSLSFTFSSNEAGATFQCSLDGAAFTTCTSPRTYTNLLDGLHAFQVRARDAAGNMDPTPASYSWTVDRTAPIASITSLGPPTPTNLTTASFTFTSNDPAASFQCRLDGAAFASCVSPVNYSGLANGTHNFRVRAIDAAGNVGAIALRTWSVDTTPPNTTITGNPGTVTTSTSATFTFGSSQTGSTFACSLDGTAFTNCTSPLTYTGLATGSHSFRVRATDPAGNTDPTPAVFSWTIQ